MLLSADVQTSVKEYLSAMVDPVTVALYTKSGEVSSDTMVELWQEVSALTDKLQVQIRPGVPEGMTSESMEGVVSELWQEDRFTGVRYLGIASGHEFGPLMQTLVELSTHRQPEVTSEAQEWIGQVQVPVKLQVFVTAT